jgi:hypothetical protein
MVVSNSLLIVYDPSIIPFVNIFHKETGVFLNSAGTIGPGPEELVRPGACSFDHKNKILYIFDAGKRSVFGFNITNIINNTHPVLDKNRIWEQTTISDIYYHLKDSLFIAYGYFDGLIVSTVYKSSYRQTYMPDVPADIEPKEWHTLMRMSSNTVSPDGSKFVSATILGGILDIYSIDRQGIKLKIRKNFYKPIYDTRQEYLVTHNDETFFVFYSLSSTDSFLYAAVYCEVHPMEQPKILWKFDWNANPVTAYNSVHNIRGFVADEQSQQIFALVYNTDGELALARGK